MAGGGGEEDCPECQRKRVSQELGLEAAPLERSASTEHWGAFPSFSAALLCEDCGLRAGRPGWARLHSLLSSPSASELSLRPDASFCDSRGLRHSCLRSPSQARQGCWEAEEAGDSSRASSRTTLGQPEDLDEDSDEPELVAGFFLSRAGLGLLSGGDEEAVLRVRFTLAEAGLRPTSSASILTPPSVTCLSLNGATLSLPGPTQ